MSLQVMELKVLGLDSVDLARLNDAGYSTIESLCQAEPATIIAASQLPVHKVQAACTAAHIALGANVLKLTPESTDSDPIARALGTARRLQRTSALVRQACQRVKHATGGGRRRSRKLLKGLAQGLERLERDLLMYGATPAADQDVRYLLHDIDDRMRATLVRKTLKPRHVRRLRTEAEGALLRVEALRQTSLIPAP
ncbi:MAG: hypothetical protein ACI9MC_002372 [Kiritimatiellia bacterium]|jgi:hypothetical protein